MLGFFKCVSVGRVCVTSLSSDSISNLCHIFPFSHLDFEQSRLTESTSFKCHFFLSFSESSCKCELKLFYHFQLFKIDGTRKHAILRIKNLYFILKG